MMLRYTFDLDKEAEAIEAAVKQVLKDGYRTIDIMPQEEDKRQRSDTGRHRTDGRSDLRHEFNIGY